MDVVLQQKLVFRGAGEGIMFDVVFFAQFKHTQRFISNEEHIWGMIDHFIDEEMVRSQGNLSMVRL